MFRRSRPLKGDMWESIEDVRDRVMKSVLVSLFLLATPASAEDWQYFAVVSDGRYLSDDDSFRIVGSGKNDLSIDVQVKNFDSGEGFRVAIGLVDCLWYGNGPMVVFPSSGQPYQRGWNAQGHRWLDLAGLRLCDWAKTQFSLIN